MLWIRTGEAPHHMLTLDTHRPTSPAPLAVSLTEALDQAARDADAVPGAYSSAPWAFRPANASATALLEGFGRSRHTWIVVTCTAGDAESHIRERAYTAVQRYLLSLAVEGVDATWIADGIPPELDRLAGLRGEETVLGVIRVGA